MCNPPPLSCTHYVARRANVRQADLSLEMEQYLPQGVKWKTLRSHSHSREEIISIALNQIERSPLQWSSTQLHAYNYLRTFLYDPKYADVETAMRDDPELGTNIIANIGELFLAGGLDDIPYFFDNDTAKAKEDYIIGETRIRKGVVECIRFNAGHPEFQSLPVDKRRKRLFSNQLHESAHAVFFRYEKSRDKLSTGHHYGWQIVAEAMQRKSSEWLDMDFDLGRERAFLKECRATNRISLTNREMRQCFGDTLSRVANSETLLNHGQPIAEVPVDKNKVPGRGRSIEVPDSGADFLLVDT